MAILVRIHCVRNARATASVPECQCVRGLLDFFFLLRICRLVGWFTCGLQGIVLLEHAHQQPKSMKRATNFAVRISKFISVFYFGPVKQNKLRSKILCKA